MKVQHWQLLHDWKLEDIRFDLEQIWEIRQILIKHPSDKIGDYLRDMIKSCKKHQDKSVRIYEKIYGGKPNVVAMRKEVEV